MNVVENLINQYKTYCYDRKIEWIIVHYTGCIASAENVCKSMARPKPEKEQSSSHYIVDNEKIVHSVDETCFAAWHCSVFGKKTYCGARNGNSIGIDLCERKHCLSSKRAEDNDWYFPVETEMNAAELVANLMNKYGIDIDHVVRHYDVTRKRCPAPFVGDETNRVYCTTGNQAWISFKNKIIAKYKELNNEQPNSRENT